VAASTCNGLLLLCRNRELQQLGQRRGASMMHGRAHRHLNGFQIQTVVLAAILKDDAE